MDDDGVPTPGGKSRYGRLDPRRLRPTPYADHPTPPEGYVNVWVDNFRRWQKRWLVATTPGVLIFHRRSTKIGPSTSVDLTVANVVVSDAPGAHPRQFLVVTGDAIHRVRALHASARQPWVDCIKNSALKFEHARQLVRSRSLGARDATATFREGVERFGVGFGIGFGIGRGARAGRRQARVSLRCVALEPDARPRTSTSQTARGVFSTARARASIGGASRGGSARGREGMGGEDWTRRTGRPGGGGRIRDERVGVREQRDGAPFRDGARGGDREVRVGRGGVRSSPRAGGASLGGARRVHGARRRRRIRTVAFARDHATRRRTPSIFHEDTSGQGHARAKGKMPRAKRRSRPWW